MDKPSEAQDEWPDWTDIERAALRNLARALKGMPPSVHLYEVDGNIHACKQGVSSWDLTRTLPGNIIATACITDAHDSFPERRAKP